MPAPNLGLVGAEGGAALNKYLTDLVATRRAQELQDREFQMKQQELADRQAAQRWQQQYQQGLLGVQDLQAKAEMARANQEKVDQFDEVQTVDETGKPVTVRINRRTNQRENFPTQPKPQTPENPSEHEAIWKQMDAARALKNLPPLTGEEKLAMLRPPKDTGMSEASKFLATMRLQNQWDQQSRDYRQMRQAHARMDAAWNEMQKNPNVSIPAATEAIQMMFEKALDPGSVVREGEFARALLTQSYIDRARGFLAKVGVGGTGIPPDKLGGYVDMVRSLSGAMQKDLQGVRARTTKLAQSAEIDPTFIFDEPDPRAQTPGAMSGASGGAAVGGAAGATGAGAAGGATPPPKPGRTVSRAALQKIAEDKGTSVEVQEKRYKDAGYTIKD